MNISKLLNIAKWSLLKLCFVMVILGVSGCGQNPDDDQPSLLGEQWQLTELNGKPLELVEGLKRPTLALVAGLANGISGINHYSGSYELNGANLTFGEMIGTRMAGPDPAMDIEQAFLAALEGTVTWAITDRKLILFDEDGRAVATFIITNG